MLLWVKSSVTSGIWRPQRFRTKENGHLTAALPGSSLNHAFQVHICLKCHCCKVESHKCQDEWGRFLSAKPVSTSLTLWGWSCSRMCFLKRPALTTVLLSPAPWPLAAKAAGSHCPQQSRRPFSGLPPFVFHCTSDKWKQGQGLCSSRPLYLPSHSFLCLFMLLQRSGPASCHLGGENFSLQHGFGAQLFWVTDFLPSPHWSSYSFLCSACWPSSDGGEDSLLSPGISASSSASCGRSAGFPEPGMYTEWRHCWALSWPHLEGIILPRTTCYIYILGHWGRSLLWYIISFIPQSWAKWKKLSSRALQPLLSPWFDLMVVFLP